jgi:DNA-binding transcriptional ArsR family regulator
METNLSMKTGRFSNLAKAIEIIYKNKEISRKDLMKKFAGRSASFVIEDLLTGSPATVIAVGQGGSLVNIRKEGREHFYSLNEKGKKFRQKTANDLSKFLNSKGIKAKPKTMFESYFEKAREINEDMSMVALDPETSKFMVDTLLERIKNKKEDSNVYMHLKKVIAKWNLNDYAKKKIVELKLNPRVLGLLGIK